MTQEARLIYLKTLAQEKLQEAEQAYAAYAKECELGEEREKAFEIFENIRVAGRVY